MGPRLFRIAGVDIHVDWSLLIIFFLIFSSLALGVFPAWHPDWSAGRVWSLALVAALLFFASVLLHELSHALVGRLQGVDIPRITLFIFGGMAHVEREPQKWRAELWMAGVGPVTSLAIGGACLAIVATLVDPQAVDLERPETLFRGLSPLPTLLLWLGQVNVLLGLFNLVPGFPLDGGRVLRALLWGITGNLRRATRWASALGQGFAWLLIATGFLMILGMRVPIFGTGLVGGLWLAFIGWFLNNAALMSYRQLLSREALEGIPVSRLMQTRLEAVPPDITVQQLVDEHLLRSGQHAFPVLEGERLVGMVCLRDINRLEAARRESTQVREIMTPLERLITVEPRTDTYDVLSLLASRQIHQLPVLERGRLRGLVRREDILRWLALHEGDTSAGLREQPF